MRRRRRSPAAPTAPRSRRSSPARSGFSRRPDRKSTRLNSSHQIISYAVFCLKKKKTRNHDKQKLNEDDVILEEKATDQNCIVLQVSHLHNSTYTARCQTQLRITLLIASDCCA